MEKNIPRHSAGTLPLPSSSHVSPRRVRYSRRLFALFVLALVLSQPWTWLSSSSHRDEPRRLAKVGNPAEIDAIRTKCNSLHTPAGPPRSFWMRQVSDRYVEGTKPTLIRNATIWTGAEEGHEVVKGDILLDGGLIKGLGVIGDALLDYLGIEDKVEIDAKGAWVSPGIVDMHSHLAVDAAPALRGAADGNSHKGPILPWLRALDGLNTHDEAYALSISGGVTTALVLPGSANAIGGQGAVIKLRRTEERSPTAMLLENPYEKNETLYNRKEGWRFRQMKHACGENPDRVYSNTRMDTTWAFRQAYDKARSIKRTQDAFCDAFLSARGDLESPFPEGSFPEDIQWEALVDVLRGRVKVHNHCYETVDLDDMVRITNEFEFEIAAFHHAHETYLVPGTLKAAYGHPPAAALFATKARFKRESYRGSEFAPRILAGNGIQVVMKSDHPVLNSRHLIYEAQQAHYYGLPDNLALLSVTGTPATIIGEDHRVGFIKKGHDADIILWDSHPLALGATPQQVWIDGIAQLDSPYVVNKPAKLQSAPQTPNFDREAKETMEYDGLPPLAPRESSSTVVVFTNITGMLARRTYGYSHAGDTIHEVFHERSAPNIAVFRGGRIEYAGSDGHPDDWLDHPGARVVDLQGGWITPALVSFGSPLGLEEIMGDASTSDSWVPDALIHDPPTVVGGSDALFRAADGLQYETRDALLAYRSGVTTAVTAPKSAGLISGLSASFSTGAVQDGLAQEIVALHVSIGHSSNMPSVSTQIAALRNLLRETSSGELGKYFSQVTKGEISLIVHVESADAMVSLLRLKKTVEQETGVQLKMVFAGATEAHLLAGSIAEANVGVILTSVRPFPHTWESRRILPGPPLTQQGSVALLLLHNVTVAVGINGATDARSQKFDLGWIMLESGGELSLLQTIALASTSLERLLGVSHAHSNNDLVATKGGDPLQMESQVVAIISQDRGIVDFL